MTIYCGVEGGGTTWRVAIAEGHPSNITELEVFPTLDNASEQLAVIRKWLDNHKFDTLGIATFGPIDPNPKSSTYGYITTTPKPGWHNVDVVGALSDGSVPVAFDTDVNAPALAEYMWNGAEGETSCAYITVGTGIGVGLVVNGKPIHGLLHPEAGHLCLQRMAGDDFAGVDELFGASVEGLAATPGLAARKGCERSELANLSDDDPIWEPTAHALGSLCASLVLVASPERIVLSGGVLNRTILYPMTRKWTRELLHGYIDHPKVTTDAIDTYITPSNFGQRAGIVGALTLAHVALEGKREHFPAAVSAKEGSQGHGCAVPKAGGDENAVSRSLSHGRV
eukprot:TRINITY_DN1067_c0_g1_i1.p1 TRINITY_DN1067_c0_g1~~TRINITY_DN1067_c0_g1_i1.p1  ORF type:complete len:361 (+),score=95.60 TRINITY_DN1067_c0_g1_i1:69-1085(+)